MNVIFNNWVNLELKTRSPNLKPYYQTQYEISKSCNSWDNDGKDIHKHCIKISQNK